VREPQKAKFWGWVRAFMEVRDDAWDGGGKGIQTGGGVGQAPSDAKLAMEKKGGGPIEAIWQAPGHRGGRHGYFKQQGDEKKQKGRKRRPDIRETCMERRTRLRIDKGGGVRGDAIRDERSAGVGKRRAGGRVRLAVKGAGKKEEIKKRGWGLGTRDRKKIRINKIRVGMIYAGELTGNWPEHGKNKGQGE